LQREYARAHRGETIEETTIIRQTANSLKVGLRTIYLKKYPTLFSNNGQRKISQDFNLIEINWANMKHFLRNNLKNFQFVDSAIYNCFGLIDNQLNLLYYRVITNPLL